ncbi:hypothetical protein AB0C27_44975 [Nonomuraea sp. NPDC048882]|uniref:effector-associated constant component EACC1 n=1 Tax=unclassified Nonomuraea TaxID=2593643 RepID=UPI0033CB2DA9
MDEIRISGAGHNPEEAIESLWEWLHDEPELRGRVTQGHPPVSDEDLGMAVEIVITAASSVTVMTALAQSLRTWLTQQRADVKIEITHADGRKTSLSAQRVRTSDVQALLREAQAPAPPDEA